MFEQQKSLNLALSVHRAVEHFRFGVRNVPEPTDAQRRTHASSAAQSCVSMISWYRRKKAVVYAAHRLLW